MLNNSTQERMKSRKNRCPWRISTTETCGSCLLSGHWWPWELTFCIAPNQRPSHFFTCMKRLALPSLHLKLFFNTGDCCSCYKKVRWAMSSQAAAPAARSRITENTSYKQTGIHFQIWEFDRISTALRYTLIIHIQRVNISISKSCKWFKSKKLIQIPNLTLINIESWHWYHIQ